MANTTNFGWETPDDTDLVKDGAAAMRTLGSAIDTSMADLKGGTTGQVLAKNSNTDMDFIWTTDATGIPATIVDAKGDLIAATAADTVSRLAVGTNGQILTADSTTATGLKWETPASGSIVKQAKFAKSTSTFSRTTGTQLDMISITITPTSNSNNLIISWSGKGYAYAASGGTPYGTIYLYDGTTSTEIQYFGHENFTVAAGNGVNYGPIGGSLYVTSPGTSAKTFTLRLSNILSNGTVEVNSPTFSILEVEPA